MPHRYYLLLYCYTTILAHSSEYKKLHTTYLDELRLNSSAMNALVVEECFHGFSYSHVIV